MAWFWGSIWTPFALLLTVVSLVLLWAITLLNNQREEVINGVPKEVIYEEKECSTVIKAYRIEYFFFYDIKSLKKEERFW